MMLHGFSTIITKMLLFKELLFVVTVPREPKLIGERWMWIVTVESSFWYGGREGWPARLTLQRLTHHEITRK